MRMLVQKKWLYLSAVVTNAGLIPLSYMTGKLSGDPNLWLLFPIFFAFVVVPLADLLVGLDAENPSKDEAARLGRERYYGVVVRAILPIEAASIAWGATVFATDPALSWFGRGSLLFATGVNAAVFGITAAHELIHRPNALDQTLGGVLLSLVCYGSFKVEHVHGHHVHVATPLDTSSAVQGQTVYGFVPRALIMNSINAWHIAARRCQRAGVGTWSLRNELLWWTGLSLVWLVCVGILLGPYGMVFFLGQSLVAASMLEGVNYIEHYGLRRRKLPNGLYERTTPAHSWNGNHLISNILLFQLQRHSDHHAYPSRPYQSLRNHHESPQLPAGYAVMLLVAFFPPLWQRLIHPLLERHEQARAGADLVPTVAAG